MKSILLLAALAVCSVSAMVPLKVSPRYGIANRYIVSIEKDGNRRAVMDAVKAYSVDAQFGHEFKGLNAFVVIINYDGIQYIRTLPGVSHIEQDTIGHIDQNIASWGLDRTDQRDLPLNDLFYPESDGAGANVYVVDTGIYYAHNDYQGRAEEFDDRVGGNNPGGDCNGHGSHCAGTVGGNMYGVAKAVKLWGVRTLNCAGGGIASETAAAMENIGDNGTLPGVLSMSLSFTDSTIIDEAADYVIDRGYVVVTSSSNDNADACAKSPQRNRRTISVGSTDNTDTRSSFSNYGTCQDIWAPGEDIISCGNSDPDSWTVKSGTSMSCPHVAGVAAIKVGLKPSLTPDEVKTAILNDATVDRVLDGKEAEGTPNLLLFSRLP